MIAPCKGCPDRHLYCHSECDKYKEYAIEKRRVNREKQKLNDINAFFLGKTFRWRRKHDWFKR